MKKFLIELDFEFPAAHMLRNNNGPCGRLHGHNWKLQIVLKGQRLDDHGFLVDFFEVKKTIQTLILDQYDHQYLNVIPPFDKINPTCEHIADWIFTTLQPHYSSDIELIAVSIWENSSCKVTVTTQ